MKTLPLFSDRSAKLMAGHSTGLMAGVDEAGRGPLAGPVYAAAVILDPKGLILGVRDSKKLSACQRVRLAGEIRQHALAFAVARAEVEEIDRLNILHATMLAMRRAIVQLATIPAEAWIDGNRCPDGLPCPARAIVKGDATVAAIAAASILAKTARDAEMLRLHETYPHYGFDRHMGYPTPEHLEALQMHGVSAVHRRSFGPVRQLLRSEE
jgi:ribonuclease HII